MIIGRRLDAISKAHQVAGHDSPSSMRHAVVSEVWKGIRRAKGCAQRAAVPVLTADVRAMVRRLPEGLLGIRDRALLLLGFSGALRRSELTGLDVEDLEFTNDGAGSQSTAQQWSLREGYRESDRPSQYGNARFVLFSPGPWFRVLCMLVN